MYTIKQVAEMLNISKETVYKKLQSTLQSELQSHVFKTKKGTLINDTGIEIIRNSLKNTTTDNKKVKSESIVTDFVNYNQLQNIDLITFLKAQIEEKDKQIVTLIQSKDDLLQSKDKEIEAKNKQINSLIELNKNNQILLKQEQDKNIMLEKKQNDTIVETDNNINEDLKENLEQKKQEQKKQIEALTKSKTDDVKKVSKKSFWNNVFRR